MGTKALSAKLRFKRIEEPTGEAWVSGIYKVVKYGKWYAYFKPEGWKNWGNSCEHEYGKSKPFNTRLEAQKSAQEHSER